MRSNFVPLLLVASGLVLGARSTFSQEVHPARLEALSVSESGGLVTIDKGSALGLRPGDRVTFFPVGALLVEGRVESTTKSTALVKLDVTGASVEPGTRCEIEHSSSALAGADTTREGSGREEAGSVKKKLKLLEIDARSMGVKEGFIEIDRGGTVGIQIGDRVIFRPKEASAVHGTIADVEDRTARVRLAAPDASVDVGVRCIVLVPSERSKKAIKSATRPAANGKGKPRWTSPEERWDQDQPLLTPLRAPKPEERDKRWRGRVYTGAQAIIDHDAGNRRYYTSRTGIDISLDNPFERGGTLRMDAEFEHRAAILSGQSDVTDTRVRIDRFYYAWGGTREEPDRWAIGRFLQHEFPELGYLDGVEYAHRTEGGSRFGASVGFMPDSLGRFGTGRDLQASVFYRYVSDPAETLVFGTAFQKTFHEWESDRDLLLTTIRYRPNDRLMMQGAAWIDFYGSEDTAKSASVELTELHASALYRFENGDGMMASFGHRRFPQLLRTEYFALQPGGIMDNHTERLSLSGWHEVSESIRAHASGYFWLDEDETGGGGEVRFSFRDLLFRQSTASIALFGNDGQHSGLYGFRLGLDGFLASVGHLNLLWETARHDRSGLTSGDTTQHRVRASWNHRFDSGWMVSAYLEERFGDELGALSMGFNLQYSF